MKKKYTLLRFIVEKRGMCLLFLVSTLLLAVVAPFKSYIMQWLIDAESKTMALQYLVLGMGVILASHVLEYISRNSYTSMAAGCMEQIRTRVMEAQLHGSLQEYLSGSTGEVLSLLTNDMRLIYDNYYMGIFNIVMWGGMLAAALVMLACISPVLLVISAVLGMAVLMVPRLMAPALGRAQKEYSGSIAAYTGLAGELLKGFETVHTSQAESYVRDRHGDTAANTRRKEYRLQSMLNRTNVISSLASWVPNITVLLFGVFLVYEGRITVGYLVAANSLSNFVISPCRLVSGAYTQVKSALPLKQKIEAAMNREELPEGEKVIDGIEEIRLEHVQFTYPGAEAPALKDISFSLGRREKIALVGLSGSGKSTAAKLLYRYYTEYGGHILVNGLELGEVERESYYRRAALILQSPFLFSDTIYNNICLGKEYPQEEIEAAIGTAGLRSYIDELPEGLDTVISENGKNLSGGQAQRVAIARAVLRKCDLMIVDEPTSSLDANTTREVMDNLLALDCMLIVITHDVYGEYMQKFNQIYYMENGMIQKTEKPLDLLLKGDNINI